MKVSEVDRAKAICQPCPARPTCLLWALSEPEGWGVWGGYTRPERQRAMEHFDGDTSQVLSSLADGTLDTVVSISDKAAVA